MAPIWHSRQQDCRQTSSVNTSMGSPDGAARKVVCQVEGCNKRPSRDKEFYSRHRLCRQHSRADQVMVAGQLQRFCQQCCVFHPIASFDNTRRSCREGLALHTARRREKRASLAGRDACAAANPVILDAPRSSRRRSASKATASSDSGDGAGAHAGTVTASARDVEADTAPPEAALFQMDERRRHAIDAAAHAFASARLDTARSLGGTCQKAEPEFDSNASDFDATSGSEDGDDGPASCDYSDEEGAPDDGSPSYGALLPPGLPRSSPHLLDFAAASHPHGGYFGSPTAGLAPVRGAWAPFSARAADGSAQPTPALSAFGVAAAGAGSFGGGGTGSPAPDANAPNLNPFAAQRKRSWALTQQASAGEQRPGGLPPHMRHSELDTLRAWSLDGAHYQAPSGAVIAAAPGAASRVPASVSSLSLPPTKKPRSFSADLRELSQLDCEARGFRPASVSAPSVADIHRMAARLSGIVDAATEDSQSAGVAGAGPSWPGSMVTTSLPSRFGSTAQKARASMASLQRHTSGPASGDAGEQMRAAVQTTAEAQQGDGTLRSSSDGGVASRAASSDLDLPLATAWSWGGIVGGAGAPPPSSHPTAATGAGITAAAKQDALQRLRPGIFAGKPPLAWQLGTRSNSSSTGTASLTPSTASTSWALTPRSLIEAAPAASDALAVAASPFELPACATPFQGTPAGRALGFGEHPAALHARGRSISLPLGLHRLRASTSAENHDAAPMAAADSVPDTAHGLPHPGTGRTVRALSMPIGGPRQERAMSKLGRVSTLGSADVISPTPKPTLAATAAAALQ